MSSNLLKIIPTDPVFVPELIAQAQAKAFLFRRYPDNVIESISDESVEFIDQGENFGSVSCNLCGSELHSEDWQNAMDVAYESQFIDLMFTIPCCKKNTSLNDLSYEPPAGFARFSITISNPHRELSKEDLEKLQALLGTGLRIIRARY